MSKAGYKFSLLDYAVLAYFISHIPITLLVDGQAVLPPAWYPEPVKAMVTNYAATFQDELMAPTGRPAWFKSVVLIEVLLQVPFFFFAVWGWLKKSEAVRIPTIIYGAHTATTLIPIYGSFLASTSISEQNKLILAAIYLPYLLMPLYLMLRAAMNDKLFPGAKAASSKTA